MLNDFLVGDIGTGPTNIPGLILGLILALIGGHILAWVYMLTHSGLSYLHTFVRSIVIMPAIVALVMNVLANNIIVAFGMMAVFAIVRFRNLLRDTLDTTYILAVLVLGMAAGSQKFTTAIVGLTVTTLALIYLWATSFGTRRWYDLILHLQIDNTAWEPKTLENLLKRHSRKFRVTTKQQAQNNPNIVNISIMISLRDPNRHGELLSQVQNLPGVLAANAVPFKDELEF